MKKIFKIHFFSLFAILSPMLLEASFSEDKIVEAKRIKKIDDIVKQENFILKRITSYVAATGDLEPTRKKLQVFYNLSIDSFKNYQGETCKNSSGYCDDNETGGISIEMNINNNQISIGNSMGIIKNLTEDEIKRYRNSIAKNPNAETSNDNQYRRFAISDYDEVTSAINIVKTVSENPTNSILQSNEPSANDRSKIWLKPVGDGSFEANIYNPATKNWESRGSVSGRYDPNRTGTAPMITFFKDDVFDAKTTMGQKGWIVNVETKYGFGQYKHNGTEWILIAAPDNKVYEFADIESLMNEHFTDPLGSIISGVTIPNTTQVVEFTKYSKYWATKNGLYFIIDDKKNLPTTVKNGAKAWTKNGNLILVYDATINAWIALFENIEYWKAAIGFLTDGDYIKLESDGKKYKFFARPQGIAALDGMTAFFNQEIYPEKSPDYYGLKDGAIVTDWSSSFHSVVRMTPNGSPSGKVMLNFLSTNGTFLRWMVAYSTSKYLVMYNGSEYFWSIADYLSSNYKTGLAAIYHSRYNVGIRTGNAFTIAGLPNAQAGQKLYADRDGNGDFYTELIEYTGQSDGTWISSISGTPLVDYTFSSLSQAYPSVINFVNEKVAVITNEANRYYRWRNNAWVFPMSETKLLNIPYGKQKQFGYMNLDFQGITSDGQYYYTKVYPAATFADAQRHCTTNFYQKENLPSKAITTAGTGSISAEGSEYMWTTDVTVAGTRVVFNGNNTKIASEVESLPYRCILKYDGSVFPN